MNHSNFQIDIYKNVKEEDNNLLVNAVAGSGKTTTIIECMKILPKNISKLSAAFNRSIVKELSERSPEEVETGTMHSIGMKSVRSKLYKTKVVEKKIQKIIYESVNKIRLQPEEVSSFIYRTNKMVDIVRLYNLDVDDYLTLFEAGSDNGFLLENRDFEFIKSVLEKSNKIVTKEIDFIDMIYQPVRLNFPIKKYDVVFIDEVQDLSVIQQEFLMRTVKRGGKFIGVGDEYQAIYGFAGADFNSFQKLKQIPNTKELPLSICYRCDKSIVTFAQKIVPHIRFREDADNGVVRNGEFDELKHGDMVLCRNNQPLVRACLDLMKEGKKAKIKGRDIANELIGSLKQAKHNNVIVAKHRLQHVVQKQYDLLKSYGVKRPEKTASYGRVNERVSILTEEILPTVKTVNEGIKLINDIFDEKESSNRINLSSIHKAKGLENERVFVLKPELMPSKFAQTSNEKQQEKNLEYVCYTRAKKELIFLKEKAEDGE